MCEVLMGDSGRKCAKCGRNIDMDVSFETKQGSICLECKAEELNRKYRVDDEAICPRCGLPGELRLYKGLRICQNCMMEVDKEILRPQFLSTGRLPVGTGGYAIYLPSMSEEQIQQRIIDSLIDVAHQEGIAGWSLRVAGLSLNSSDQFFACLLKVIIDELKILTRLGELNLRETRKLRQVLIEALRDFEVPSPSENDT